MVLAGGPTDSLILTNLTLNTFNSIVIFIAKQQLELHLLGEPQSGLLFLDCTPVTDRLTQLALYPSVLLARCKVTTYSSICSKAVSRQAGLAC